MGTLLDRNRGILTRIENQQPIAEAVRARIFEGNALVLLAGQTPEGQAVAPLKPSTLRHRQGTGPPRIPRGRASQGIAGLVVVVVAAPSILTATKTWPAFSGPVEGMNRTRPMVGFRPEDLAWLREQRRTYIMGKGGD